jgi:asparagine synthase (glutamine-hydrolysing)
MRAVSFCALEKPTPPDPKTMCSILGLLDLPPGADLPALRTDALERSARQRHRGPDWSGVHVDDRAILVHERLAIVGTGSGAQPLRSVDGDLVLAVNGEIYNHADLRAALRDRYEFTTDSDCEVINALYREHGDASFVDRLEGIFAFVLWDRARGRYLVARDGIGVCPLYFGADDAGVLHVASEMKALLGTGIDVQVFPPGHVLDSRVGAPTPYWAPRWRDYDAVRGIEVGPRALRATLEGAVRRQSMSEVPYGVLLSGGLDSSLVAACAVKAAGAPLHSFAIGLAGAPDLAAARIAADAIGTTHHELHFTVEEGIDALPEVVRHIESYDVTSIRASTPMFLMARKIRALGVKMVLSGEGADEVFGGYLYFHKAPSARAFHEECVRKLDALHLYDCNRANKAMAAWGVEARVPFLDRDFLAVSMGMDAEHKRAGQGRMEKAVLRRAFDGVLPDQILWRQKEQFSDGVGYGWIDALKAHAERIVTDAELAGAAREFPHNPPATKEALWYRRIFAKHFPGEACARTVPGGKSIACSTPAAIEWDAAFAKAADPSGRAVAGVHLQALA